VPDVDGLARGIDEAITELLLEALGAPASAE